MQWFVQQLINALNVGSLYALIALGYTMVFGVLRLINFAHGDVFMVGAFAGAYCARFINRLRGVADYADQTPWQALAGILLAMAVCGFLGYAIERLAYRPLRKSSRLSALITAIGISMLIEYLAQIEWKVHGVSFFGSNPTSFPKIAGSDQDVPWLSNLLGVHVVYTDLIVLLTTLLVLGLLWYIVKHTRTGQAMRAVSINYDAARLMGIDLNRIISLSFILGSMLAAVGGCLFGLRYNQCTPLMGLIPGLKAFIAAVIGGIGNIPGAAAGGLLLGLVETLISSLHIGGVSLSQYQDAIAFVILIVMLLVRPEGLLGKAVPEKV